MHTSHITTKNLNDDIANAMMDITAILTKSYGPLGAASILSNGGQKNPLITKDGKTILDSLKFMETPLKQDILLHIRSIANKLVSEVGDGSTSSVLVAFNVFRKLKGIRKEYVNGKKFEKDVAAVEVAMSEVIDKYLSLSLPEDKEARIELLSQLAAVSNNNDADLGKVIAEIMVNHANAHTVVSVKNALANTEERITFDAKSGFEASHAKINDQLMYSAFSDQSVMHIEQPIIVTTKDLLQVHYNHILTAAKNKGRPVFIFAETVEDAVKAAITKDTMIALGQKQMPLFTLFNAVSTTNSQMAFRKHVDFEIYAGTDSNVLEGSVSNSPESMVEEDALLYLGGAESISINKQSGIATINGGEGLNGSEYKVKRMADYLFALTENLNNLSSDMRIQRGEVLGSINRLKGQSLTIFVGGHTEDEKDATKALVHDSVLACQSTMKSGYTVGANLAPLFALELLLNTKNCILTHSQTRIATFIYLAYLDVRNIPFSEQGLNPKLKPDYSKYGFDLEGSEPYWEEGTDLPAFVIFNTNEERLEAFLPNAYSLDLPETQIFAATNTDKAILKASLSIVTLLLNSNQYISN